MKEKPGLSRFKTWIVPKQHVIDAGPVSVACLDKVVVLQKKGPVLCRTLVRFHYPRKGN